MKYTPIIPAIWKLRQGNRSSGQLEIHSEFLSKANKKNGKLVREPSTSKSPEGHGRACHCVLNIMRTRTVF